MRSKAFVYVAVTLLALIVLTGACSAGFVWGRALTPSSPDNTFLQLPQLPTSRSQESRPTSTVQPDMGGTPADLQELFKPFWEAWNLVHERYVDQPVDNEVMMRGAIRGMLESLGDQHTSYMDPEQYRHLSIPLEGEYEGIGAWVDPTSEYLTIVSPIPDSPAEKAGLKPGDQIIAVDGEDMTGIDGELVLRRVLGPAGTTVRLTISREGEEEPIEFEIVRANIILHSVEREMLGGNIGYVRLNTFGEKSTNELRQALRQIMREKPEGLILDLRNNGGGFLATAIEIVSEFIGEGVVMYEQHGDGQKQVYEALPGGLATEVPLVVLINEGTASASEIVAGAIQDYERGTLVGVTSFGKGSVQSPLELSNDQGVVRITIARWLTPKERQIHGIGIQPDVEIPLTDEDIQAGRDPQLDKALELLRSP